MDFSEKLLKILSREQILEQEPMSSHTTFRIGGAADYVVFPREEQVKMLIELCKQENMPYMVIGNGSNLLVGDKGIRGVVIAIAGQMNEISIQENEITVQAGAMLVTVASKAAKEGLTGLEFASGIPGTMGGALTMNAGAYGGEMKDVVKSVTMLTEDGQIHTLTKETYDGSYRSSAIMKQHGIVLHAVLTLESGVQQDIDVKMKDLKNRRIEKQPLEYPSAGSTFKRPEGYFAGKLIMDSQLAGYRVGGAQVSEKHCGFVINTGGATAKDVVTLMEDVETKVRENYGVQLEPEVRIVGEF